MRLALTSVVLGVAVIGLGPLPAHAQSLPDGWRALADSGAPDAIRLEAMAPGWHLFPGPAAVLYEPERRVDGPFRVVFEAHVFHDAPGGYGIIFGAPALDNSRFEFFEILLDGEGRYRLGHRAGSEYHEVIPWTPHDAIAIPTAGQPANNRMVVEVSPDRLAVLVNGQEVTEFDPPEYVTLEGVIGIRALEGTSAHITELEVEQVEP